MDNLHQRDRVGVDDCVLLDDYRNRELFIENLRKRFNEDIIYTYIGTVLISINPYRELSIYNDSYKQIYANVNFYQLSPHIFAIADSSFRQMVDECRDQCILISGESGAGKTESSKKILEYLSNITSSKGSEQQHHIKQINNRLLLSNPILESFGNAKTSHNNNSSRFGKYMDIEFDYLGHPLAGHIDIYLLEKSRVVYQNKNEQNFHIFYLLLGGASDEMLKEFNLRRDPLNYFYLNQQDNNDYIVDGNGDGGDQFETIQMALEIFDFNRNDEQQKMFAIVAAILHLGNVGFFDEDNGQTIISNMKPVTVISKLLECDVNLLKQSLLHRTIEARDELMTTDLTRDQAIYARDALAKAIYQRLFVWLVSRLNQSLHSAGQQHGRQQSKKQKTVMGLLDIYGFEIFQQNNFEQFCINYCNEKLQQLFIELTLKQEQEEYQREQIEWEPVEYFNNRIICDLIEEKHRGIIAYLDEECLRPGDATDLTFLSKLDEKISGHPHYCTIRPNHSNKNNRQNGMIGVNGQEIVGGHQFRITHYAGDVDYEINGFIDKNNDLLYRDLKKTMCSSNHSIIKQLFNSDELSNHRRPTTTATQFRQSLSNLMSLLATKQPWYIRCIKPNNNQRSKFFDEKIVCHQVQYLGLMENLRVRRAGFAYRRNFNDFLERYKCLCPKTWPYYEGSFRDGVQELVDYFGFEPDEYRMGLKKIFIRSPQTLFRIEDAFQQHKHVLATTIQAVYRGWLMKKRYETIRKSMIALQANIRRYLAKKNYQRRRQAANQIRAFIKGFITRNGPSNQFNQKFKRQVKIHWLTTLSESLPNSILNHKWPMAPICCQEASKLLCNMHRRWLARKYCLKISPKRKEILQEKVLAENLFKNKKQSYLESIPEPFESNRLDGRLDEMRRNIFENKFKIDDDEKTQYCSMVNKYDRHGYHCRQRMLILTNKRLYLLEVKKSTLAMKETLLLNLIKIVISNHNDGLFIIKIPIMKKEKGDLILEYHPRLIELLTKFIRFAGQDKLIIDNGNMLEHQMSNGKKGQIQFCGGERYEISKRKDGQLQVMVNL
uniref:Myosin-IB-like n=1 Tax=Dermatophagoides pteronyssinus TaxID=6956 RepID=A0A6P6YEI5_DERPT|nr:myosin-IB-like [Dermatophagoides pteronyssinus]